MITKNFLNIAIITCSLALFTSCSGGDDHDHSSECHGCHLALPDGSGGELMYDITNAAGGEEFCGDELEDAESNTFYFEVPAGQTLTCSDGGHPIGEGQYGPGADTTITPTGRLYEVHCEDHGSHDGH